MDMSTVNRFLDEISETALAEGVVRKHDAARNNFVVNVTYPLDCDAFWRVATAYYVHHYRQCVGPGAEFEDYMAFGGAQELLDKAFRLRGLAGSKAAEDVAVKGLGGGLQAVLDAMAEHFRNHELQAHVEWVYNQYAGPCEWGERVELLRHFVQRYGPLLPPGIMLNQPERYVRQLTYPLPEPLQAYVRVLQQRFSARRQW